MLFVTQLNHEAGTDMAWSTWLVLKNDKPSSKENTEKFNQVIAEFDDAFGEWQEVCELEGDYSSFDSSDEAAEAWIKKWTPRFKEADIEAVGLGDYFFNTLQQ